MFKLKTKKIIIKPIVRQGDWLPEGHSGEFMYDDTAMTLTVPISSATGRLMDPLTDEERKFFEDKSQSGLSFEEGDLNINKKGNHWENRIVTLSKNFKILDLLNYQYF